MAHSGMSRTHLSLSFSSQQVHFGCRIETAFLRDTGRHTQYVVRITFLHSSYKSSLTWLIVALYWASRSMNSTSNFLLCSRAFCAASCSMTELSLPPDTE